MWSILIFIAHFTLFTDSKIIWTTPTTHDFGEILRGKSVTYIFEFTNTSNAPLIIDNVRTDCGCTASDWEETPVEAGAQGRITIHFDAGKTGYFKKKIAVWIKGMKKAEKLSIEGEVIEE